MMILKTVLFAGVTLLQFTTALTQWYPLTTKDELRASLKPFTYGTKLPIECMSRNIDNGEHDIDLDKQIVFIPFPSCKETGESLSFQYGINEDISCTIGMTDEIFHLFQLYLHEDAPFSCRLPISSDANSAKEGLSVPLLMNIRGTLSDSHIHVDNNINVLNLKPDNFNSIISSVAFSSGTNVTRVIIGDMLKLNFAVRWMDIETKQQEDEESYHYASGFYKLPQQMNKSISGTILYILLTAIISSLVTYGVIYVRFNKKNQHNTIFEYDTMNKRD